MSDCIDLLLKTLQEFVETSSLSGSEECLRNKIRNSFYHQNATHEIQVEICSFQNSLVIYGPILSNRPTVILAGHLDTISGEDWWDGKMKKEGNVVVGLGVSDMKGGLAVMRHLLTPPILYASRFNLIGIFYEHEEEPSTTAGLQILLRQMPRLREVDFAFLLEPTENFFEVGCVGSITAEIKLCGRAAHSGRPWNGDNAAHKLAPILFRIGEFGWKKHDLGGICYQEVLSATRVEAGTASNVIPASAKIVIDYRYPPIFSPAQATARLREYFGGICEVTVLSHLEAGKIPAENLIYQELKTMLDREERGKQGFTDVATFARYNIDAINFGPGDPEQCHKLNETLKLSRLVESYDLFVKFICRGV
jgi:succinyl-diaminopimelate desuccinylase